MLSNSIVAMDMKYIFILSTIIFNLKINCFTHLNFRIITYGILLCATFIYKTVMVTLKKYRKRQIISILIKKWFFCFSLFSSRP